MFFGRVLKKPHIPRLSLENDALPFSHVVEFERWSCPICTETLDATQDRIGALVYQGRRVENSLYHAGCVSAMLIQGLRKGEHQSHSKSPVSRNPVDGFLSIPVITDPEQWLQFLDWKREGCVAFFDLLATVAATLSVNLEETIETIDSVCRALSNGGIAFALPVPITSVRSHVIPVLHAQTRQEAARKEAVQTIRQDFVNSLAEKCSNPDVEPRSSGDGFRVMCAVSSGFNSVAKALYLPMRCVCVSWNHFAHILLIQALSRALRSNEEVVVSAARLMRFVVLPTDKDMAINVATSLLSDERARVEEQGVRLLAKVVSVGDPEAMNAFMHKVESSSIRVVQASVGAVGEIANREDREVIEMLCSKVSQNYNLGECTISFAAIKALLRVASTGDEFAIAALLNHLRKSSRDADMASFTMSALSTLADRGDQKVIAAIMPFLTFEPAMCNWVRKAALKCLSRLAQENDATVLNAMKLRLADSDLAVRTVAYNCLSRVASKDNALVCRWLLAGLDDEAALVQVAALEALSDFSCSRHRHVNKRILKTCQSSDAGVRRAAVVAIGRMEGCQDRHILVALHHMLHGGGKYPCESDSNIRCAIQSTIEIIESKGEGSHASCRACFCIGNAPSTNSA